MGPRSVGAGQGRSYRPERGFKAAARASHLSGVVQGTCGNLSPWPARPLIADRCVEPCRGAEPNRHCVDREAVDRFECGPLPFDVHLYRQNRAYRIAAARGRSGPVVAGPRVTPPDLGGMGRGSAGQTLMRPEKEAVGRLIDLLV